MLSPSGYVTPRREDDATVPLFSMRLVALEHRMRRPLPEMDFCHSDFSGTRVERVPVVTVFGSTPQGQSACLHIHKVMPYFYVPFPVDVPNAADEIAAFLTSFGRGLEAALNEETSLSAQRVFNLQLVSARDFYGFHSEEQVFVKILLYNPRDVSKAVEKLQSGRVLGIRFQPYETHLPFHLQFKMDFNLFGMGQLNLRSVRFRQPLPETSLDRCEKWRGASGGTEGTGFSDLGGEAEAGFPEDRVWTRSTTLPRLRWDSGRNALKKQSRCELELDAVAEDISNVHQLRWENIDGVGEETRVVQSLGGFWPEDTSFLSTASVMREPTGELCEDIVRIKEKIRQMQELYRTSRPVRDSLSASIRRSRRISLTAVHSASNVRTPISPANSMTQKLSHCACRSPIREDVTAEDDGADEDAADMEDDPIHGQLLALAEAAEEDLGEHMEQDEKEIQDIMTCHEGAEDDEVEGAPEGPAKDQEAHGEAADRETGDAQMTREEGRGGALERRGENSALRGHLVPKRRPPCRREIAAGLDACISKAENKPPRFEYRSPLDQTAWKQTPCFTDRRSHWDEARSRMQNVSSGCLDNQYQDERGCWSWGTCAQPPNREEIDRWLQETTASASVAHEESIDRRGTELPTIAEEDVEYGERPDSPDYDESSSFFFTPRSLKALTTARKRRKSERRSSRGDVSLGGYENRSDIAGTSAADSSRWKRQRRSETGFKLPDHQAAQQLVACCIEVHAASRLSNDLLPDPICDAVHCVVLSAARDDSMSDTVHKIFVYRPESGVLKTQQDLLIGVKNVEFCFLDSEKALLLKCIEEILLLDPDVLIGYEMQKSSLGYLAERGMAMDIHFLNEISRLPTFRPRDPSGETNPFVERRSIGLNCPGRILLNAWRILRREVKLNIYTFENCAAEVLKIRLPKIPQSTLHAWFRSQSLHDIERCFHTLWRRAQTLMEMIDLLDVIGRTAEMARIYGVDFFSVLSRGSQYRVESMLVRLAHTQNCLMISPSAQQVFEQPAMESIPLVMEPCSDIVCDPVVVLDFQSLYPSLVIAYNLCFSTICAKNVSTPGTSVRLGVTRYISPEVVWDGSVKSEEFIVTPNGMVFLPPEKKRGILPRLLKEILETRVMIKKQMKMLNPDQKALLRCLNSRQFGLKMIANVSYGYTAAAFSGRMPMAELADSIVQSGRQTLLNTIDLIQSHPTWNARVVYGDSVAGYTPVYVRHRGVFSIERVETLAVCFPNTGWQRRSDGKEVVMFDRYLETWSDSGWTKLRCLIRHRSAKKMFRVRTHGGVVDVTADHSLLRDDGTAVTPADAHLDEKLLHAPHPPLSTGSALPEGEVWLIGFCMGAVSRELRLPARNVQDACTLEGLSPVFAFKEFQRGVGYKSVFGSGRLGGREKLSLAKCFRSTQSRCWIDGSLGIPSQVFGSNAKTRRAFLAGFCEGKGVCFSPDDACTLPDLSQISAAGIAWLADSIGLATSFQSHQHQADLLTIVLGQPLQAQSTGRVQELRRFVSPSNVYVYDISTSNHHFAAGPGRLVVHNTDSVFVRLPGRRREEAFVIGQEIAEAVTRCNPAPLELKLEKVYHPCALLTKKHYVGYMFESPGQEKPYIDSKGIETIRRDSCPAVSKILQKVLAIVFSTKNLSSVQKYLQRQWTKILSGQVSIKDFIFSKEVRVGGYRSQVLPPAAIVASKVHFVPRPRVVHRAPVDQAMEKDPRAEPLHSERIPYVVVYGQPGARLIDLVVDPHEVLDSEGQLKINALYYITKQINPAVDRVLSLVGVSVQSWFAALPRSVRTAAHKRKTLAVRPQKKQRTIDSYYVSRHCPVDTLKGWAMFSDVF